MNRSLITKEQQEQYEKFMMSVIQTALKMADLPNRETMQALLSNGDKIAPELRTLLRAHSVTSNGHNYSYYRKPKPIFWQISRLKELFPGLSGGDMELTNHHLPMDAEGWFAIPRWQTLAESYDKALQMVLDMIQKIRGDDFFHNYCNDQINPQHLSRHEHTDAMLDKLYHSQNRSDTLIIPTQFGIKYANTPVDIVRGPAESKIEIGFGGFEVGMMLLTHPERLLDHTDLWPICPGDCLAPKSDGYASNATAFNFTGNKVEFGSYATCDANNFYAPVTGFMFH